MRAVYVEGHGERHRLIYTDSFPDPQIEDDEVLVRVVASSVNYHDIFTRRGMPGIEISLPIITGSDISGEIARVGPRVNNWKPGDRVLIDPICPTRPQFGMVGETTHGGRAEYVKIFPEQLIRLPAKVTFAQAACLPLAYGTAHRMLMTRGRLKAGERILILGASGGVGVACVQLAKLLGAEVIACASSKDKLDRLTQLGADHVVDYRNRGFREAVYEIWGKPRRKERAGADVVVNFTGGDTWLDSLKCIPKGGRVLVCGATAGYDVQTDLRYVWTYEENILGSNGWEKSDLLTLLSYIEQGKLDPVVDQTFPLEQASEAERLMEDRELFGKLLITP